MKISRRSAWALAAGGILGSTGFARASDYPGRGVKVIVPFPAGGTVDPPARIVAEALSILSGQRFLIDNRSGAGGTVGADNVAKAESDGYTLLASNGSMTIAQAVYPKLPWDAARDFTWIGNFGTLPSVLIVNVDRVPATTLPELIAFAASRPKELDYGSPGSGTASHLAAEMLKEHTGLRMRHIPYRGAAPASTDLLGGQIDVMVAGLSTVAPLLAAKQVRAIASTGAQRAPQAPTVPTVAETHPGFGMTTWLGLAGPSGLAPEVTERIAGWTRKALADPATSRRLVEIGITPSFEDGGSIARTVARELAEYPAIVRRAGIKPD